jgi:Domain of unknown function (DUF2017)
LARRTFDRARDGSLVVTLHPQEVDLLVMTARDMATLVEEPPDGDVRDRLYPRAYLDPTEETAQRDYDALVHDDLVRARRTAFETIADRLEAAPPNRRGLIELVVGPTEEAQWLTGVNDARLVIGTALGVTEETDTDYARDDPRFEYGVLYSWLTALHFELVSLLLDEIGEAGSDDDAGPDPPAS